MGKGNSRCSDFKVELKALQLELCLRGASMACSKADGHGCTNLV